MYCAGRIGVSAELIEYEYSSVHVNIEGFQIHDIFFAKRRLNKNKKRKIGSRTLLLKSVSGIRD